MKILKELDLNNVVFIDIETVNAVKELQIATPLWDAWKYKLNFGRDPLLKREPGEAGLDRFNEKAKELYNSDAALYPEFGKIVCITIGKIKDDGLKLKSYVGDDEKVLLAEFCNTLTNMIAANKKTVLCGHAIKGFDIPWLMRRCIVNQVELPTLLDTAHLKPWETTAIDTMDLWKGTSFNGASLIAITTALGLHNPKDELAGYQTNEVYYNKQNGLKLIQAYCEKDVTAVANIVRKCRYEPVVEVDNLDAFKVRPVSEGDAFKVKQVGVLNKVFNTGSLTPEDENKIMTNYSKLNAEEKVVAKDILDLVNKKA